MISTHNNAGTTMQPPPAARRAWISQVASDDLALPPQPSHEEEDRQQTISARPGADPDRPRSPISSSDQQAQPRQRLGPFLAHLPGHQVSHHPQDRCAASADARRRSAAIRCSSLASCGNSPPEKDWKDEASQSRLRAMTASP